MLLLVLLGTGFSRPLQLSHTASASFRPTAFAPQLRSTRCVSCSATTPSDDASDVPPLTSGLPPKDPPRSELVRFALPALGIWLGSPLLSLVDTSAVGLSAAAGAGASQLAALGPATTFCDGAAYLFAFLNTATTNLYASALASGDDTEAVVRRAARVALVCGAALVPLLLVAGKAMLSLYVGPAAAADLTLINPASAYVAIRTLSFPAALLGGVLQAALLGAKDSATPLIAIAYSTVANVILDVTFVAGFGWGLSGAALATLAAQWLSTIILIRQARVKLCAKDGLGLAGVVPRSLRRRLQAAAGESGEPSTVPTGKFLVFAAPVLTLIVGKIAAFGFLTHAAAGLGSLSLAAHQIGAS